MKQTIINYFLPVLIKSALNSFSAEQIKVYLDHQIDRLEKHIIDSSTSIDDAFLPVIKTLREAFDLPDLPDVKEETQK